MKQILIFLFLIVSLAVRAQELNCQVTVNFNESASTQVTDRQIFPQMQAFITEFMNNRRWTNDVFAPEERLNCKLIIDILKVPAQNVYEGRAQFILTRPVYGSSYETVIYRYIDNQFNFPFRTADPMFFNENTYQHELTSLLAFHALMMLGYDYDSFGKQGGRSFFQRAFNVMNLAPPSGGWSAQGDFRNRYWLIENLQNQQFIPFREAFYSYHRLGLDVITRDPVGARKQVIDALTAIRQVNVQRPSSMAVNMFFDGKAEELYNVMTEATREERLRAYNLLSALDPAQTELYRRLLR